MHKITKFYFQQAKYIAGDDLGNEVVMELDYKNNRYKIRGKGQQLLKETRLVAKSLLKRKSGVNLFANIKL